MKSLTRFEAFRNKLESKGIITDVADFDDSTWMDTNFADYDICIYYPSFEFTSSHPLSLSRVKDNLAHIHSQNPGIRIYPDPEGLYYYGDKYRQYLFLKSSGFPIPHTIPLVSEEAVKQVIDEAGFPVVVKNRFGAGGDFVYKVDSTRHLYSMYRQSMGDLVSNFAFPDWFRRTFLTRSFLYSLIKRRRVDYPFLSPPLLAQEFVPHQRDLKVVVGDGRPVEAHWRELDTAETWKANIDAGAAGIWSHVPESILELCVDLASKLKQRWLNVDLFICESGPLISEFSPVWHHYRYAENENFVYKDDYNLMDLKLGLDLEELVINSLIAE